MTDSTHSTVGGDMVSFRAHEGVIDALEHAAAQEGVTRSHFARRLIANYLRREGYLPSEAPATNHEAKYRQSNHN